MKTCEQWGIRENEVNSLLKTILVNPEKIPEFLKEDMFKQIAEKKELEEKTLKEVALEAPTMTLKELRKELGISKQGRSNKVAQKGLHFESNLENYLKRFMEHWNNSFDKVPELLGEIGMMAKEEILTREYETRMKS